MTRRWNWLRSFQRGEDPKGFTLVEILVAVTILSIILTIIYGSFAASTKSISTCRERSDIYQIARLSLDRMAEDISCAFLPEVLDLGDIKFGFTGEDGETEGMPRDVLNFISTSNLQFGKGLKGTGLCEIGYYMETDPETDELLLIRREDDSIDDETDKGGFARELADRIKCLDFKYYDGEGEESEEWYSDDRNSLPRMVKIILTMEDENEQMLDFSTRVYLEMSSGLDGL